MSHIGSFSRQGLTILLSSEIQLAGRHEIQPDNRSSKRFFQPLLYIINPRPLYGNINLSIPTNPQPPVNDGWQLSAVIKYLNTEYIREQDNGASRSRTPASNLL